MDFIQFGNSKINFEIKTGNRKKTVAIHIRPSATVTILTPPHLDDDKIRMIIRKKARWILDKQGKMEKSKHSNPRKEFVSGESFPYLGKYYRLKVVKSASVTEGKCRLVSRRLVVEVNGKPGSENGKTAVKKVLMGWYINQAEEKIGERASRLARLIGKWPTSIKIKNQDRRWGSCSKNGEVRFNWKIVMVPASVMDYVVTHELCHLIYPHHSTRFWQKVQSIIPDYKRRREWLKSFSTQTDNLNCSLTLQ